MGAKVSNHRYKEWNESGQEPPIQGMERLRARLRPTTTRLIPELDLLEFLKPLPIREVGKVELKNGNVTNL